MLLQILIALFTGIWTGVITGLTPGLHINLVSVMVLTASSFLLQYFSAEVLAIFIIAMAITHTFLDALPSIYLGAPDDSQALNVLPGHRFLLKGLGHYAVLLTLIGSIGALIFGIIISPLLLICVKVAYPIIKPVTAYILILLMIYMIFKSRNWKNNLAVFLCAGTLGIAVLNTPELNQPLFPLLSGLFGMSVLIYSLMKNEHITKQSDLNIVTIKRKHIVKPIIAASFAGFIASFLPGLGASEAAIIVMQFFKKISNHSYMILVGGINTASMLLSLITLFVIQKARNGAVVVLSQLVSIDLKLLIVLFTTCFIAGCGALLVSLKVSKIFGLLVTKIDYQRIILFVIFAIVVLVLKISGFLGILVLVTACFLGIYTVATNISRHYLMGCLILPVILYLL